MTIILFILIFGVVVISHELGHFLLAKANGIHVVEFAVGMGPTLLGFTKGDTKYSLKLFPIGGACMFEGEDGLAVKEGEESKGAFPNAPVWGRISTVLAGPVFNFILAFLISLIMVQFISISSTEISTVQSESPAAAAGLKEGDKILSLNGEKMHHSSDIVLFTMTSGGDEITVFYEREGEKYKTALTPEYDEETGRYLMGITMGEQVELKGFQHISYAWYEIRYFVKSTFASLKMLVTGKVSRKDVAGPVGIAVNVVGKTYDAAKEYGWQTVLINMMNITLMLSVNLGILNLLPLPALDGGRLVFLLLEVIRGKPVPPEKEGMVHFAGLIFFMALMVLIFFNDLVNIFH